MSIPRIFSAWYFKHTPKRKMKESSCNLGLASLLKAGSVPTSYPLLHCLFLFSFLSHSIVGSHSRKGCMCMCSVAQSCLTLCNPTGYSPPGSSVHGILQARTLVWVAISFSNACMQAKLLRSCPTLCDPMDTSPPGSFVHGILRARILEWVGISVFGESS